MIKLKNISVFKIPYLAEFFTSLNAKLKEKQIKIEAKFYENYAESNTPGIYLSEQEKIRVEQAVNSIKKDEIIKAFQDDRNALNDLLHSEGWKVLLKYIEGMEFDTQDGTLIERLAIKQAKEQAINAVLSIPESFIKFYDKEIEE